MEDKPFARVEKRETPEHWSVLILGCGLGLDFREEKVARNIAEQINAAFRAERDKAVEHWKGLKETIEADRNSLHSQVLALERERRAVREAEDRAWDEAKKIIASIEVGNKSTRMAFFNLFSERASALRARKSSG